MAKKQRPTGLEEIFRKTEPPAGALPEQPDDPITATGIGLRKSEWIRLEGIAKEMGMKKHALAAWALRDFLRRYKAGEIQTENRPTLPKL